MSDLEIITDGNVQKPEDINLAKSPFVQEVEVWNEKNERIAKVLLDAGPIPTSLELDDFDKEWPYDRLILVPMYNNHTKQTKLVYKEQKNVKRQDIS